MAGLPGLFDIDERLRRLSELGDQLEAYARVVDFAAFRPALEKALAYSTGAQGGRPPYDPVLMLKVLVIQATNGLSDERAEFLISDRLSFMRFAEQKARMALFVRTIGIARAKTKIGMANLVYNMRRLAWLTRAAAA